MLAEAGGLSDAEVQGVRTAALLHDIGNMAVPEHILAKPTPLTPEEFERVKNHPRVGAEILRNVPFGAPVADWCSAITNGGTASGIRPVCAARPSRSARASSPSPTATARCRADRPYRPARTEAAAIAALREEAGTAFDPALVDLLIGAADRSIATAPPTLAG